MREATARQASAPAPTGAFRLCGVAVVADPAGALWFEDVRLLVVSDLHLEKGSAYAARGVFLPPYDTAATLARLGALVARLQPRCVVALGDSFHDPRALSRMAPTDLAALRALQSRRDWIWITGNHDDGIAPALNGEWHDEWRFGGLTLRHEPQTGNVSGEIAGHLHPVARVTSTRGSLRRRCIATDGARCILPAFGAFAGGLNIRDPALAELFSPGKLVAHTLGRDRVYPVPLSACIGDI